MTGFIVQITKVKRGEAPKLLFTRTKEGAEMLVERQFSAGIGMDDIFVYDLADAESECSLPIQDFSLHVNAEIIEPEEPIDFITLDDPRHPDYGR